MHIMYLSILLYAMMLYVGRTRLYVRICRHQGMLAERLSVMTVNANPCMACSPCDTSQRHGIRHHVARHIGRSRPNRH